VGKVIVNRTEGVVALLKSMEEVAATVSNNRDMSRSIRQFAKSNWGGLLTWHRLDVLEYIAARAAERYVLPKVGENLVSALKWALGDALEHYDVTEFGSTKQIVESLLEEVGLDSGYFPYITQFYIAGSIEDEHRIRKIQELQAESAEWHKRMGGLEDLKRVLESGHTRMDDCK
jgi:hypothetical protein